LENCKITKKIRDLIFRSRVWLDFQKKEIAYIEKEIDEIEASFSIHKVKLK
jgi:hypothetical protein